MLIFFCMQFKFSSTQSTTDKPLYRWALIWTLQVPGGKDDFLNVNRFHLNELKSWNPGTNAASPDNEPDFHMQESTGRKSVLWRPDPGCATKDGIVGNVVQSPELKATIWASEYSHPKNWELVVWRTERRSLVSHSESIELPHRADEAWGAI